MTSFDLIVLGAGSGGIAGATRAAQHGARVALVEPDALGGTCVNRGCVPKKAMWIAAQLAEAQADAVRAGFNSRPGPLDWPAFIDLRETYIRRIHASYVRRFETAGIEHIEGRGRLLGHGKVAVGERVIEAAHILIATGARPHLPALPGAELGEDSDNVFRWRSAPARVALVGSGYVAVEFAGVLQALGCAVDVYARGPRLVGRFDAEISERLASAMRAQGVGVRLDHRVVAVEGEPGAIGLRFAGGVRTGPYERLVWAIGRDANVEELGLDAAGVALTDDGHIAVDASQDTSAALIHAVGDVTGRVLLTPVAIAAARRLMDRIFGGEADARLDYACIPSVLFSHPPLGVVGLSEEEARAIHGASVEVHRGDFRPMRAGLVGHGERSFFKMVCAGADRRIVGLHLLGEAADEMLQGFAVAIRMGATKADFDATVAIHPTSAEEVVLLG